MEHALKKIKDNLEMMLKQDFSGQKNSILLLYAMIRSLPAFRRDDEINAYPQLAQRLTSVVELESTFDFHSFRDGFLEMFSDIMTS